jgi:hypothetical protein
VDERFGDLLIERSSKEDFHNGSVTIPVYPRQNSHFPFAFRLHMSAFEGGADIEWSIRYVCF